MSDPNPSIFSKAIEWFEDLRRLAGAILKLFKKAERDSRKAKKKVKKAVRSFYTACSDAHKIVGDTDELVPPTKEAQLAFWTNWMVESFEEELSSEYNQPTASESDSDSAGDDEG